jgi:hypothetical protein
VFKEQEVLTEIALMDIAVRLCARVKRAAMPSRTGITESLVSLKLCFLRVLRISWAAT